MSEVLTEIFVMALVSKMRGRPSWIHGGAEKRKVDDAWHQIQTLGFLAPEMRLSTLSALLGAPMASAAWADTDGWVSEEHSFSLGDGLLHNFEFIALERLDNGVIWGLRLRRRTVLPDSEIQARLLQNEPEWSLLDYECDRMFSARRSLERWDWDETVHYAEPVRAIDARRPRASCEAVFDWGLLQRLSWQPP